MTPEGGFTKFGEPQIGRDQAFVTRAGLTFHVGWCQQVIRVFDEDPGRLLVIDRASVGLRRMGDYCLTEGPLR